MALIEQYEKATNHGRNNEASWNYFKSKQMWIWNQESVTEQLSVLIFISVIFRWLAVYICYKKVFLRISMTSPLDTTGEWKIKNWLACFFFQDPTNLGVIDRKFFGVLVYAPIGREALLFPALEAFCINQPVPVPVPAIANPCAYL